MDHSPLHHPLQLCLQRKHSLKQILPNFFHNPLSWTSMSLSNSIITFWIVKHPSNTLIKAVQASLRCCCEISWHTRQPHCLKLRTSRPHMIVRCTNITVHICMTHIDSVTLCFALVAIRHLATATSEFPLLGRFRHFCHCILFCCLLCCLYLNHRLPLVYLLVQCTLLGRT
jgi:hypothetical protein